MNRNKKVLFKRLKSKLFNCGHLKFARALFEEPLDDVKDSSRENAAFG